MPNFTKFWSYADIDEESAELRFYGEVMSEQPRDWWTGELLDGEYITPELLKQDLEKAQNKKVLNIKLNSGGGDAYVGLAIHNALKGLKCKKVITIDGLAASAAATIACCADVLKMYPGSLLMIHNAKAGICGYMEQDDLKKYQRNLEAIEKASAAIYAAKSGIKEETIRNLMDRETWYTGAEALAAGFADELLAENKEVQLQLTNKTTAVINSVSFDCSRWNIPERLLKHDVQPTAPASNPKVPTKEVTIMTLEELKAQHPQLCADLIKEATAEAVQNERARIQAIDEIAGAVNDADLVKAAKFTDVCSAEQLALRAFQSAAQAGKKFLAERAQELQQNAAITAPALAATPEPAQSATEQKKAQDAADYAAAIAAVNSIKRR